MRISMGIDRIVPVVLSSALFSGFAPQAVSDTPPSGSNLAYFDWCADKHLPYDISGFFGCLEGNITLPAQTTPCPLEVSPPQYVSVPRCYDDTTLFDFCGSLYLPQMMMDFLTV